LKKVLMLLANEFKPDVRVEKEARALTEAGYEVKVLAWDRTHSQSNKDYAGLKIEHIRTRKVRGKRSFFLSLPSLYLKMIVAGARSGAQIVHAHDLDTLLPSLVISKLKGIPLVYDAHEHYARMVETDISKPLANILDRFEMLLVPKASLVIAANQKILEYLAPQIKGMSVVVMNCIDLLGVGRKKLEGDGKVVLFYGGSLEPLRYIEETLGAVENDERCIFRIAGRGRLQSLVEAAAARCDRIIYIGYISQKELLKELQNSDAVVVLFNSSNENNRIGTPNRLFEAMAMGVPVLASEGTLSGQIVDQEGCGIAIHWNRNDFSAAIATLTDPKAKQKMGESGTRAATERYNWTEMRKRLIDNYSRL